MKKWLVISFFILLLTFKSIAADSPFKDCTRILPEEQEEVLYLLYINDTPLKVPYIPIENPENKKEKIYYFPATDLLKALNATGTYDRDKDKLIINNMECPKEFGIIGKDIKTDKKILYLSFRDILKFLNLPVGNKETNWGVSVYTRTVSASTQGYVPDPNNVTLKINPMIELDFKTKSDVYRIRKDYVAEYPELLKAKNYTPSDAIFGQITDGKPWWGILGIYYYGPGDRSIEGASEESRFLANPYLLIGLTECYAHVRPERVSPDPPCPKPTGLTWNVKGFWVQEVYSVSNYFKEYCQDPGDRNLTLIAYNARDFGYNYLYVVPDLSTNVTSLNKSGSAAQINQFIHCGTSCGYPGGGNNMSPYQEELLIQVKEVPARAYISLWKNKPASPKQKGDMTVIIDMQ